MRRVGFCTMNPNPCGWFFHNIDRGQYWLVATDPDAKNLKGKRRDIWSGSLDDAQPSSKRHNRQQQSSALSLSVDQNKNHSNISVTRIGKQSFAYQTDVACYPLISLLMATNLTKLDFLSLDIEGKEDVVLYTLPWDLVNVKFWL